MKKVSTIAMLTMLVGVVGYGSLSVVNIVKAAASSYEWCAALGCDENGFLPNGTHISTGTMVGPNGFFKDGTHSQTGTDYDPNGFNREGIHQDTGTEYGPDGYDRGGYDQDGYDRHGYDRDGYDRDGWSGIQRTAEGDLYRTNKDGRLQSWDPVWRIWHEL